MYKTIEKKNCCKSAGMCGMNIQEERNSVMANENK